MNRLVLTIVALAFGACVTRNLPSDSSGTGASAGDDGDDGRPDDDSLDDGDDGRPDDGGDDRPDDGGDDDPEPDTGADDGPDPDTGADDGPPPPSLCEDFEPEPIPGLAQAVFEKDVDSDGPRLRMSSRWFECNGPFNWPDGDDCRPFWNFSVSLPPDVVPGVYDLEELFVSGDVQMAGCEGFGSGGAGLPGYLEIVVINDECVGGTIWGVNDFPVNGGFVALRC